MIFEIADLHLKLKSWEDLVSKLQCAWFLWNLIEHANYENINWNWWPWPKIRNLRNLVPRLEMCSNYYEILHLEQIEHVDYELIMNSNWWSWPKIIDSGKFGPNTEICSEFSNQIEHAYYEYHTRHWLERSHDYRLRMIVGSKHGTIIRTIIVAIRTIIVPCSEWL